MTLSDIQTDPFWGELSFSDRYKLRLEANPWLLSRHRLRMPAAMAKSVRTSSRPVLKPVGNRMSDQSDDGSISKVNISLLLITKHYMWWFLVRSFTIP